jgi:hypothetical protein
MHRIVARRHAFRRIFPPFAIAVVALGGCKNTSADLGKVNVERPRLVARPGVSPRGARVAITGVEGAPEEVTSRFSRIFTQAAERRDIATAPLAEADYRVRGYLSAYSGEGAAHYAYVWDVFDRDGRRAQRLTDEIPTRGEGDPWSKIDEKTLTDVAVRGADDLAAFLSNTTEAIAAAGVGDSGVAVADVGAAQGGGSPAAATPLGFAQAQ